jgi:hypothetical protein
MSPSTDGPPAQRAVSASGLLGRAGSRSREGSPHAGKFRAATIALVGIGVVAIVAVVAVIASQHTSGTGPSWSAWKPPDGGNQGAREIADHLAPFYRISGTDQLAVITVLNLGNSSTLSSSSTANNSSSGLQVAVQPDPSSSSISLLSGHTIAYNLCGVGTNNCSIGAGSPSSDRLLLLRREALELALYTFKYIPNADNVVAVLPPGHTTTTSRLTAHPPSPSSSKSNTQPLDIAVLFVRGELAPWLKAPLSQTLTQYPPLVQQLPLWHQTEEAGLVDQITARGLFSEKLETTQDGTNLLVLNPLPPQ